ncbi:MAG: undecaprenyl-phosphate glucose phosphotransferase [Lachnospiraceae bacterium]|nr:undecaprenyl-phosphate glucose phosphotransferase [Lachnospiraceae bacterium]
MIKKNQTYLNRISAGIDFLLVFLSYLFSAWFRLRVLNGSWENKGLSRPMILASVIYSVCLIFALVLLGFYRTTRVRKLSWKLRTLFLATTLSIFAVTAVIFVFKIEDVSRGIIAIFYLLTLVLLGGKQLITRAVLNQLRRSGYNIKHEILVGSGRLATQYREDLSNEPELGIQIDASAEDEAELEQLLGGSAIDEVVLALEPEKYGNITKLISVCEKYGVKYYVVPFYNDMIPAHPVFESIGRTKLVNMRANRLESLGWAGLKRAFDIFVSTIGLLILSPLLIILAIGVKLSSPGPVFFRQERVGYNRKRFSMLKFRSMVVNNESDTAWSKKSDNRRTKFGSFIRKTSLDELPQLINVLRGDMSLVGPRPELPFFVEKFKEEIPLYMVKHQVKPGITGWAQVNGYRGDTSIRKRIELDIWYIDNWSPMLDLKILLKTFPWAMINDERMGAESETIAEADIKVIVAAHKSYWMPSDELYVPMQVGAEGKEDLGYTPDNTGDNISSKNANYCELTGLYWAWKNLSCDYLGLAHYRRHFTAIRGTDDRRDVLTIDQARDLLGHVDVLLPKKRNYLIETNYKQYIHAHHAIDLDETRRIIEEKYPEYLAAYDTSMKKTKGHRFNMFIMKKDLADRYCTWLFDILFELEKRLDISDYSENDQRVFGFVAERLLDVWLDANEIKYKDIRYMYLERQNWIAKGVKFVMRKIKGKK